MLPMVPFAKTSRCFCRKVRGLHSDRQQWKVRERNDGPYTIRREVKNSSASPFHIEAGSKEKEEPHVRQPRGSAGGSTSESGLARTVS